jgi:hypothetical protein
MKNERARTPTRRQERAARASWSLLVGSVEGFVYHARTGCTWRRTAVDLNSVSRACKSRSSISVERAIDVRSRSALRRSPNSARRF